MTKDFTTTHSFAAVSVEDLDRVTGGGLNPPAQPGGMTGWKLPAGLKITKSTPNGMFDIIGGGGQSREEFLREAFR